MVATALPGSMPLAQAKPARSEWARTWSALRRNRGAMIGLAIIVVLVLCAIFAPQISPHDPTMMGAGGSLEPPSLAHPFGTDKFGRDLFSRVIAGSRLTLFIGCLAVAISCTIGSLLGLISGYAGGKIDNVIMRAVDVMFSFPDILIALSVVALLGPSLRNAVDCRRHQRHPLVRARGAGHRDGGGEEAVFRSSGITRSRAHPGWSPSTSCQMRSHPSWSWPRSASQPPSSRQRPSPSSGSARSRRNQSGAWSWRWVVISCDRPGGS